jgi:halocin C8-like bacteriocin domain-containing protein
MSLIFYQVLKETEKMRQIHIKGTTILPDGDIKQFDTEVTIPKTTACDACQILFDLACVIGCGVGITVLCVLAGITTIVGGILCAAVAGAICYFIGEFGCDPGAQYACEQLGYC